MTIARSPRGIALPVLLVGVVLAGTLMAATYQVLAANQRISSAQSETLLAQQALSAAIDLLTQELRGVSASGGDLTIADTQMIAFRALRALGFTCEVLSESTPTLRVAIEGTAFHPGDQAYVFIDGNPDTDEDDHWTGSEVLTAVDDGGCGEDGAVAQELGLSNIDAHVVRGEIHRGAPVRSWEEVLYTVEQVDGKPYLMREAGGQRATLVGPLQMERGFEVRFMDAAGEPTSMATEVATARITLRTLGSTEGRPSFSGDSLTTSVFLRN